MDSPCKYTPNSPYYVANPTKNKPYKFSITLFGKRRLELKRYTNRHKNISQPQQVNIL
ncbi:hypothetical protein SAMN05444682_110111 [Parapedobacter indicus]|uniref:Uncharacterized protein n=1 Tax=Parapedobacter indicus TaxID=1477437 RepID=A0A1I3RTF2_9SPHI|nr:hypothetical protein CLV26_110135 [Parapedobacter indicus]SFJ49162.1 hypothetical protein SAMN05444682_110111 [Parapedobacter indicus]